MRTFIDAVERFPRALVLEGEAGIGKTTLWREGIEEASKRDTVVLTAVPSPAETQLAFGALSMLLDPAARDVLPHIPQPQQRALRLALLMEDPAGIPPDHRSTFAGVVSVLRQLADSKPVVVAVDDVQFLDASTAAVLVYAAHRLDDSQVAFLLAARTGTVEAIDLLEHGFGRDRFERLTLPPFPVDALFDLLHDRTGVAIPGGTLARIHEEAGGNPMLSIEIARALLEAPLRLPTIDPLPVPTELRELLTVRLDRLPAETKKYLLVAACLVDASPETLERVLGQDAEQALEPAFAARILEWHQNHLRFSHPLLAATAYANASPARRRAAHREVAGAVDLPEVRARHLALAAEGPDAEVASALENAAALAAARGLPGEGADLVDLAVDLTPRHDRSEMQRRAQTAGMLHFLAGRRERSREILERLVDELPPGIERARALLGLAWSDDDLEDATVHGEQALTEGADDVQVRADAHHLLSFMKLGLASMPSACRHAEAAVDAAETADEPVTLAQCLSAKVLMGTLAGIAVSDGTVDRAIEIEDSIGGFSLYYAPTATKGLRAMLLGDVATAHRLLSDAFQHASDMGDEVMQGATLVHWSELECRRGDLEQATHLGRHALAIAKQIGFESREVPALYALALALARQGRADEARSLAARGESLGRRCGLVVFAMECAGVLGSLELALDRRHEAASHLGPLLTELQEGGYGEPSAWLAIPDAIEALVAVGEHDQAHAAVAWLRTRLDQTGGRWLAGIVARSSAILSAADGDLDHALDGYVLALSLQEEGALAYESARTSLSLGTTLRRSRRTREARSALGTAVQQFDELGVKLWANRARGELGRISGRAPSSGSLTPAERRVAELVTRGLSNKEIASQLFVSVHTVETHLSHAFAKLHVRSRTELARLLLKSSDD